MLNVSAENVISKPFPHVVSDAILPPDLFDRLRAEYPGERVFGDTASATGSMGSRAGRNSGFDIYRGDAAYAELMRQSDAWKELDGWINSTAFIDKYQELFGPWADRIGLSVEIDSANYDRGYEEPREILTEKATVSGRAALAVHKLTRNLRGVRKVDLFTRLDITRALSGYRKPPHTDRANRLCSLIIYFTDAKATGLQGGELLVYKLKTPRKPEDAPRHPKPEDVDIVATLTPRPNRGIFFPCCNTSYHGVTAVTSVGVPRDFLYINISGKGVSLW